MDAQSIITRLHIYGNPHITLPTKEWQKRKCLVLTLWDGKVVVKGP
jgi:hypothetical protein